MLEIRVVWFAIQIPRIMHDSYFVNTYVSGVTCDFNQIKYGIKYDLTFFISIVTN